jgi:LemA protein
MTVSLALWVFFAVGIFWGLGAYNRMMRLRAKAHHAILRVDRYLERFSALVNAHLGSPHGELESNAWMRLVGTLGDLEAACVAAKASPLDTILVTSIELAYKAMQAAWFDLKQVPSDLAGSKIPYGLDIAWEHTTQKVGRARNQYQQAAIEYNTALSQFPANLLARIVGLKPAGNL